jgi:hypothetical protein
VKTGAYPNPSTKLLSFTSGQDPSGFFGQQPKQKERGPETAPGPLIRPIWTLASNCIEHQRPELDSWVRELKLADRSLSLVSGNRLALSSLTILKQ